MRNWMFWKSRVSDRDARGCPIVSVVEAVVLSADSVRRVQPEECVFYTASPPQLGLDFEGWQGLGDGRKYYVKAKDLIATEERDKKRQASRRLAGERSWACCVHPLLPCRKRTHAIPVRVRSGMANPD